MNISICITTFNEEGSIGLLLDSLLHQTKKADEIVIVDGGSTDGTVEIINHYQKRFVKIKILKEKCTRAEGRNLGVETARNQIIAITDAGCVAHKDWLENITEPFKIESVDISAGFYKMVGKTDLQKVMGVFLGVTPRKFDINFLPSTRSIAFRRSAWETIGGFPEGDKNSAEDTDFNYKAVKIGLKYARVKNAIVEWGMPETIRDFQFKVSSYASWDVRYGIWWHPTKGIASHNIKVLSIFLRYLILVGLLVGAFWFNTLPYFLILLFTYLIFAFRKCYLEFGKWQISLWGIVLQFASDFAVMSGFVSGILMG